MLYFKLNGYEEFKELFGKRECGNGVVTRNNSMLLTFWKDAFRRKDKIALLKKATAHIYPYILDRIDNYAVLESSYSSQRLTVANFNISSPDYYLDEMKGICMDGDTRAIRYARRDNCKVYKMKSGKFMRHLIDVAMPDLCEQIKNYVCETFSNEWQSLRMSQLGNYTIEVDENFGRIYDSDYYCTRDFGSCMTNDGYHTFYNKCVAAKAASLWRDGCIQARCVIFTDVEILTGEHEGRHVRLAERQYSANGDESLKRILVEKLITEGHIDGYKKIGAGCSDTRAFVWNDGTPLNETMSIDCEISVDDDYVSYQDTFKFYNIEERTAYNVSSREHDYDLSVTDGGAELFNAENCEVNQWNGRRFQTAYVSESDRDNYYSYVDRWDGYYESDWVHWSDHENDNIPEDDGVWCDKLDCYLWRDYASYSDLAEDWLPDDDFDEYEEEWKADNWEWDEIDERYVEKTEEVNIWRESIQSYETMYTSTENLYMYTEYDGEYYDEVDEDGVPFGVEKEQEVEC